MNTKLHAVANAQNRPLSFFMTAGQVSDCMGTAALIDDPTVFLTAVALAATVSF